MDRQYIVNAMLDLNIPTGYRGFEYMIDAVELLELYDYTSLQLPVIYECIAKLHQTTVHDVTKSITYECMMAFGTQKNIFEIIVFILEQSNIIRMLYGFDNFLHDIAA